MRELARIPSTIPAGFSDSGEDEAILIRFFETEGGNTLMWVDYAGELTPEDDPEIQREAQLLDRL